jgi:hypothetical protein
MAKKEKTITDLMDNMEAKEAAVDKKITKLTLLLAEVQEKEAALRDAGGLQSVEQGPGRARAHVASEDASTASPTPSGGPASTASVLASHLPTTWSASSVFPTARFPCIAMVRKLCSREVGLRASTMSVAAGNLFPIRFIHASGIVVEADF